MMTKFAALVLLALSALLPIPDGWEHPGDEFTSDKWRAVSDTRFMEVSGDFNGDGLVDSANILISRDGNTYGIFAFISKPDGKPEVHTLVEVESVKYIRWMGVERVEPGRYATACGKGYWECGEDEPKEISLKYDAINYFMTESANSFFYWDDTSKGFRLVSISD